MRKGLFDLNRDGKLDAKERYIQWMTFNQMLNDSDDNNDDEFESDYDDWSDSDDEY